MPANEELQFIAKLIESGNLRMALDEGVNASCFRDEGAKQLWGEIIRFYEGEGHGVAPTRERLKRLYPHIVLPDRTDRTLLETHIVDLLDSRTIKELDAISDDIIDIQGQAKTTDLDSLIGRIQERMKEITKRRGIGKDIEVSGYMQEVMARYERYEDPDSVSGVPYPWKPLNEETRGIQNSDLVVLYGRPKSMKTWVMLYMAVHAYNFASRRVLVYTREMSPEQMMDRTACLLINAPYAAYKKGWLDRIPVWEGGTMKDRLRDLMNTMKTDEHTCQLESGFNKGIIITADQTRRGDYGGGVEGLKQKIKDHNPDIIFVDAAYLMKNDKSGKRTIKWDDQADIVTELKETAMTYRRPIVITTQANRDSEDARGYSVRNIAFADAYGMNCDLAMEVNKKETGNPEHNELALCIPAAREINLAGFAINGDAATDFGLMMRKKRNEEGVVLTDEQGEPVMEPVIFYQHKQITDFFKSTDGVKRERKQNGEGPRTPAGISNIINKTVSREFSKGRKE